MSRNSATKWAKLQPQNRLKFGRQMGQTLATKWAEIWPPKNSTKSSSFFSSSQQPVLRYSFYLQVTNHFFDVAVFDVIFDVTVIFLDFPVLSIFDVPVFFLDVLVFDIPVFSRFFLIQPCKPDLTLEGPKWDLLTICKICGLKITKFTLSDHENLSSVQNNKCIFQHFSFSHKNSSL